MSINFVKTSLQIVWFADNDRWGTLSTFAYLLVYVYSSYMIYHMRNIIYLLVCIRIYLKEHTYISCNGTTINRKIIETDRLRKDEGEG